MFYRYLTGLDVGYSHTKAFAAGRKIDLPTVAIPARERLLRGDILRGTFIDNSSENLKLKAEVIYEGQRYWVGEYAIKNGGEYNPQENRLATKETRVVGLTALAFLMHDLNLPEAEFVIATGLPISHYYDAALREDYAKTLVGTHKVTLVLPLGEEIPKVLHIRQVQVLPQGLGAFYDKALELDGDLADESLMMGKHLTTDIGHRTVDISLIDEFEPLESGAFSLDNKGVKFVLENIRDDVKAEKDERGRLKYPEYDPSLAEVEQAFLAGGFYYEGKFVPLNGLKEKWLKALGEEIVNAIKMRLKGFASFDRIFLCGGAAELLKPYLGIPRAEVVPDPAFANARGFYKMGKASLAGRKDVI